MLCPFCLKEDTIKKVEDKGRSYYVCSEHPEPRIPIIYAENEKLPRDIISAIGFRGNGKSAYFASLFSSLEALASPEIWPRFSYNPVDDHGLTTVHQNMKLLKKGILPLATPKNFPIPTIVQFSDMPKFKDHFLIFYDTSGESFEKASDLGTYANFVTRSQTAIFFMSLHDLDYNPQEMIRLLHVYIIGLKEIGGNPKQQHLLVILTKGDLLASKLESHKQIWDYLVNGDVKNLRYADINTQMVEMKKISKLLKEFLRYDIAAAGFLSLGEKNFRTVEICIISSLGSAPKGDQLDISSTPKRIFDPILWVMNNSTGWRSFFFNLILSLQSFKNRITHPDKPKKISQPRDIKKIAKYSVIPLIAILLLYFAFFGHIQIPTIGPIGFPTIITNSPTPTPIVTQTLVTSGTFLPENELIRDSLASGSSKTYYFDVISPENIYFIRVSVEGDPFTDLDFVLGKGYVPSFKPPHYDTLADIGLQSEMYDIQNPTSGRYFVVVKNKGNSGAFTISKSIFNL